MFNLTTLLRTCDHPPIPNVRDDSEAILYPSGGTMGTLILGQPGSGKTSYLAGHMLTRAMKEPDTPIFVLDWSGSITDTFLELVASQPEPVREQLLKRIVYDELGNQELVVPLPEFSHLYGTSAEEQVQRVSQNLQKLSGTLVEGAPVLGGVALKEIAPEVFRLAVSITNEHDENWQITEAKRLIMNPGEMRKATALYGFRFPQTAEFIKREFLNEDVKKYEKEMRTYVLRSILGVIEPREVRARLGYYRPGWTPREAVKRGLIVLVTGKELINQQSSLAYLFTQAYSLIMAEINKRTPSDPANKPVLLVLDEVYALIGIKGMADEVGMYLTVRLDSPSFSF